MPWGRTVEEHRKQFLEDFARAGANRREVCRIHGVSAKTGYALWRRYQEEGSGALQERSRRPLRSPKRLAEAVERRIVEIRRAYRWGPRKIRWRMEREGWAVPARSTIEAVLRRHGLVTPERSARSRAYQRFEYPAPNQLWQMDFKGHFALRDGNRCHPLTVIDDHSRYLIEFCACANEQSEQVRERLEGRFRENGMPERILSDNGPPWGSAGEEGYTRLEAWLMRLGVRVLHGRRRHPQTQGKVERIHRTFEEELELDFRDLPDAQKGFDGYRPIYNDERPHESLGMEVPASRYRPSERVYPERLPPVEYEAGVEVRKVQGDGRIGYRGRIWRVGKAFGGELVALRAGEVDGTADVYFCSQKIAEIDVQAGTWAVSRG